MSLQEFRTVLILPQLQGIWQIQYLIAARGLRSLKLQAVLAFLLMIVALNRETLIGNRLKTCSLCRF
jgi:hypothetical protein